MTCKPILVFLEENGIEPTKENKKRWQAGWTLAEIRAGFEFVEENFWKNFEKETGKNKEEKYAEKRKRNEEKIMKVIENEKKTKRE